MPKRSRYVPKYETTTRKRTYGPKKAWRKKGVGAGNAQGRVARPRGNFVVSVPNNSPLPKTFTTSLRYCEKNIIINPPTGGLTAHYTFSANGIYDPNITGTGHQPLGFDEFMIMYEHAVVLGCQIEVHASNTDSSTNNLVGTYWDNDTTVSADAQEIIENAKGTYAYLAEDGGGSKSQCILRNKCNPGKWLGFDDPKSVASLRNSNGSNPAEQLYAVIWAASPGTGDPGAVACLVVINYIVMFTEPKAFASS